MAECYRDAVDSQDSGDCKPDAPGLPRRTRGVSSTSNLLCNRIIEDVSASCRIYASQLGWAISRATTRAYIHNEFCGRLHDPSSARAGCLFSGLAGQPLSSRAASKRWAAFADKVGVGAVTFHALRHSHASLLRHAGVALAVVSKRLGHTKTSTTSNIHTHLFEHADDQGAEALNVSLRGGK